MSNSTLADTAGYARTRLLRWRILALWLLLVAALVASGPGLSAAQWVAGPGFLAAALLLLRLWDDLADLPNDRTEHPERLLTRSIHLKEFRVIVWTGLPILALMLLPDLRRVATYGALLAALAWLYHGQQGARLTRLARGYLVLAKYPVLVVLAGAGPSVRAWLVCLLLYALLAFDEWQDSTA